MFQCLHTQFYILKWPKFNLKLNKYQLLTLRTSGGVMSLVKNETYFLKDTTKIKREDHLCFSPLFSYISFLPTNWCLNSLQELPLPLLFHPDQLRPLSFPTGFTATGLTRLFVSPLPRPIDLSLATELIYQKHKWGRVTTLFRSATNLPLPAQNNVKLQLSLEFNFLFGHTAHSPLLASPDVQIRMCLCRE